MNDIWAILRASLEEEAMSRLTDEERAWIQEKEAAARDAGEKYEGDAALADMQSLITAAKLTQERVYELAEYGEK